MSGGKGLEKARVNVAEEETIDFCVCCDHDPALAVSRPGHTLGVSSAGRKVAICSACIIDYLSSFDLADDDSREPHTAA